MSKLFFFGDSHTGALTRGAQAIGLPHFGSATMRGTLWLNGAFEFSASGGLTIHEEQGTDLLNASLAAAGVKSLFELRVPVVTTLPYLPERDLISFAANHTISLDTEFNRVFVSAAAFRASVVQRRAKLFHMLGSLVDHGVSVNAVTPPSRIEPATVAFRLHDVVADELEQIGVKVQLTRDWSTDESGILLKQYETSKVGDSVHANNSYGADVILRLCAALEIQI